MYRLLWLLALTSTAALSAMPYATVTYDKLHDMQQKSVDTGKGLDHIDISLHVTSTLCGVTAADIHLQMQSAGKPPVNLALTEDGGFKLPMDPGLYKDNPTIVSNQPKHSLQISASVNFLPPAAGTSDYRTLIADVAQINTLIHREAGMLSWFAPKVKGLIFVFSDKTAMLTIHTSNGNTVTHAKSSPYPFIPNDDSIIQVIYDKDLYTSNPVVDLKVAPIGVIPLMDPDVMKKMSAARDEKKCKPNTGQNKLDPASHANQSHVEQDQPGYRNLMS
ncbi:MAG: DUF2987 domain-containing protein [Gammaproteobacteria bacterium]|nr:DUF2987 domain-containing protein [Gammaproteobacteria bacterium]